MSRLLVIGSSNTDFVLGCDHLPKPGETLASSSFEIYAGGKGANQAVAAARAGAGVWFAGACGDDEYGQGRKANLTAAGVNVEHLAVRNGVPSGLAFIMVDRTGENSIVTFDGANHTLSAAEVRSAIRDIRPRVVATTLEPPEDTVIEALRAARDGGATTIATAAPFAGYLAEHSEEIDIIIANRGEAIQLLQLPDDNSDATDIASQLSQQFGCIVIMSIGADGVVLAEKGMSSSIPALPVEVVDTTGAGDALTGAVAAWIAEAADVATAARAGAVAGSMAVAAPGAQSSLPERTRIEKALANGAASA